MSTSDYLWEVQAMAIVIVLAVIAPRTLLAIAGCCSSVFRRLARRPAVAMCVIGVTNLLLTYSLASSVGHPKPYIHDEFAYALAGDTFAHGRLANPTHPMWEHFESYHIFHQPSYQAKYPPAQGLVLAAGQVASGEQMVGVWGSLAIACCAVYWMLLGWTRPRWALLGGLLTAMHPSLVLQWGESYWGGAVAMLGGALLFGALTRLKKSGRPRDAVIFALGLVLLANSRPYEGLVASSPAIVVLAAALFKDRAQWSPKRVTATVTPVILVLLTAGLSMGYYNESLTGNALRLPYQHWMRLYASGVDVTEMLWRVDDGQQYEVPAFELASLPEGAVASDVVRVFTTSFASKVIRHHLFFYRIPLTLTVVVIPLLLFRKRIRIAVGFYAFVWLAVMANKCSGHGHYYAPATGVLVLIVVEGLRSIRSWRIGRLQFGRVLAIAIPLVMLGSSVRQFAVANEHFIPVGAEWVLSRAQIEHQLEEQGGKHLILVSYRVGHNSNIEWVYNEAELDNATVLWARPISAGRTEELAAYFNDRVIWRLEADETPPRLTAYRRVSPSSDEATSEETVSHERSVEPSEAEVTSLLSTGERS